MACAYWASTEVHAKAQARFEWVLDIDSKIRIARQVWEEARHCKDVKVLLKEAFRENFEVDQYEPVPELTECFYAHYGAIEDPGGYFAAHNAAGERTALHMLEEAAAFARAGENNSLARFAERIIPEERLHVRLGEEILAKYAVTEEDQTKLEKYFRDGPGDPLELHRRRLPEDRRDGSLKRVRGGRAGLTAINQNDPPPPPRAGVGTQSSESQDFRGERTGEPVMAAMTPKEFIQHLRKVYDEIISQRTFVYSEWFKESGDRLREAYRQLACAEYASSWVHATLLERFPDLDLDIKTKVATAGVGRGAPLQGHQIPAQGGFR